MSAALNHSPVYEQWQQDNQQIVPARKHNLIFTAGSKAYPLTSSRHSKKLDKTEGQLTVKSEPVYDDSELSTQENDQPVGDYWFNYDCTMHPWQCDDKELKTVYIYFGC